MAMLAIPITKSVSRLFQGIDVDGTRDKSDHVTMVYFGDNIKINKIVKVIPILFEILSETAPFTIKTNKITTFSKGDDGYPVIAAIKSKELQDLRNKIIEEFEKKKVKFDNKYPNYNPHVTLSYSEEKVKDINIETCEWQVNEISLYCGDVSDTRMFVNFPLGLKTKSAKAAVYSRAFNLLSQG